MPYIPQDERDRYEDALYDLESLLIGKTKGHLTFVLYTIVRRFVRSEPSYTTLSEARSALQDAADEFYRRLIAPYEDKQIEKNGDVL